MKANIYHWIKGYDLLTLELFLMASKAEFLKAVVTSREPNWSKVSSGCFGGFFFSLFLCSLESRALVVGRNYRSSCRIYSSTTASDVPMQKAWDGRREGWWRGCPANFSPCGQDKGRKRAKDQSCVRIDNQAGSRDATCLLLLCVHYYAPEFGTSNLL